MRVTRILIQGGLPEGMTKTLGEGLQPELVEVLVMTTTMVTIGGNPRLAIALLLRAKKQGRLGGEVIGALGKKKVAGAMRTTAEVTTGEEMTEEVALGADLLSTTTTRTVGGNRQLVLGEPPPHVTMTMETIGGEEAIQR